MLQSLMLTKAWWMMCSREGCVSHCTATSQWQTTWPSGGTLGSQIQIQSRLPSNTTSVNNSCRCRGEAVCEGRHWQCRHGRCRRNRYPPKRRISTGCPRGALAPSFSDLKISACVVAETRLGMGEHPFKWGSILRTMNFAGLDQTRGKVMCLS